MQATLGTVEQQGNPICRDVTSTRSLTGEKYTSVLLNTRLSWISATCLQTGILINKKHMSEV